MKKWKQMLCVVLAGVMLAAWTAHADSEIKVVIDGETVTFDKPPAAVDGTTLVPFRVLFERLGLAVDWLPETKTIAGSGEGVELQLQLDRKTAVINGTEVELNAAPRLIDGSTYVPLRLVGEATGRHVAWDPATRTITIDVSSAGQQAGQRPGGGSGDLETFYRAFLAASNAEDKQAVMSAIHADAPFLEGGFFEEQLTENFRLYDVVTELEWFEVMESDGSEAVLYTIETNRNTNDAFHLDNTIELMLHVVKDEAGKWKIYDLQLMEVKYVVPEDVLTAEADIDAAVKAAILDVVNANIEATAAEDVEAAMATIDPSSPLAVSTAQTMKFLFEMYDLEYEVEQLNVVDATDTEAYVYTVQTVRKIDGPDFTDSRSKAVHYLKKQADGSWKLYSSYLIATEPLELSDFSL